MRGRRRGVLVVLVILTGVIPWPAQTLEAQQKSGPATKPDRCRRQIATSNAGGTISGNCYGRKAGNPRRPQGRQVSAPTLRWTNARLALAAEQRLADMLTYTDGNDRCVFPYIPGFGDRAESCTPIPAEATPGPAPSIRDIVQKAAINLVARKGTVGVLPGRALTGLPTYFSLDIDDTRETDVSEDGIDLHLEARVVSYQWDFGDGTTMRGGKGTADSQDSEIAHTYARTGDYSPSVTATWEVTFTAEGETAVAPGKFTTTSTGGVEVSQIRTHLTH